MNERTTTTGSRLTLLDALICGYLVLPLLVFCTWFKWPMAIGLALLVAYGVAQALPGVQWRRVELSRRTLVFIAAIALAWTALSGVGHLLYANPDWEIRDAVLRDLVETAWPPQYDVDAGTSLILRAPIAYYLPVAALGSVLGLPVADILLYLWTALGFALVLGAAATLFSTRRERILSCALMLGFGGLDLVGYFIVRGSLPHVGQHIEWWTGFVQYSSNSTLMFWVPNHALPAWLALLLVLRHWRTTELARMTLMLAAATPLWSPLSAFGLVPFFLIGLNWRRDLGSLLAVRSGLPFLALAGLVARYVTMDTHEIARGLSMDLFKDVSIFWALYAAFCLLEFGLLAILLARLRAFDLKLGVAVAILLVLPFFRFGPGNDLVMRCSIPALMLIALAAVKPLAASDRPIARGLLALVLVAGALGAAQEPLRALLMPRWGLTGKTLAEVATDQNPFHLTLLPPNYVGRLNQPGLIAMMRTPVEVQPYAVPVPVPVPVPAPAASAASAAR